MPSRRSFLKTGALASAGLALGTSRLTRAQSEHDSAGGPSAPSNDAIRKQLFALGMGWGRRFFDPEIGLVRFEHPPSTHLSGGAAHLIRESAHIALGFLMLGDAATASRMLERVLSKQNVDENSRFFGGFTVEYEQDWVTWKDHDLNWAQFLGNVLGYIVEFDRSAHLLSPDLYGRVEQAFSRCVQGTLRRDVTQTYTNIALLSAAVAAQGDRLLRYPGSGEFATRKSRDVLQRIKIAGSFDEYLSPTYYGTNLDAVYALRQFSDGVRAATADELIELTWKDIEAAYHPATYQLGGPHSRAYGDNMLDYAASLKQYLFLALKGDYPLAPMEINHSHDNAFAIVRSQFEVGERPGLKWEKPRFRQVQLPPAKPAAKPVYLRQYSTPELHVGSVSEQDEWIQRRNVLAYWSKPPGCGVGFMKGYFRRGEKEELAARFFSQQKGSAVLAALRAPARYLDAVSGEPNYRLVFNERALWSVDWLKPGSGPLAFSGMLVYVQSFSLPESLGTPTWRRRMGEYTTEVTTDLIWTWSDASKAERWVIAGFVLSFCKVGEVGGLVSECRSSVRSNELALSAKAGEELLELRVPLV